MNETVTDNNTTDVTQHYRRDNIMMLMQSAKPIFLVMVHTYIW